MIRAGRTIGVWIIIGILAGCTGINENLRMKDFVRTAEGYSKAISWSEFEAAAQFRKSENADELLRALENLEGVRVTNYAVKSFYTRNDDNTVEQFVEIKYYRTNQMIHKKKLIQEIWEYNQGDKQWYITTNLPDLP